jgi:DNA-binding MarR family transcriptional regulator
MAKLTPHQLDVLGIVSYCWPVTAHGVAARLQIGVSSARSALNALERKDLIHKYGDDNPSASRQRYTITKQGNAALGASGRDPGWDPGWVTP